MQGGQSQLNIVLTATLGQFGQAMQTAASYIQNLTSQVVNFNNSSQATTQRINQVAAAAHGLAQANQQVASSTSALSSLFSQFQQPIYNMRIGFLELQAAGVNTVQALASGMNPMHVAIMESTQVLGALVQSGVVGFGWLTASTAAAGVAGLAFGAATAYWAYQTYQGAAAARDSFNNVIMLGQGLNTTQDAIRKTQADFQSRFGDSSSSVREVTQYVDQLGASAVPLAGKFQDVVKAWAAMRNVSTSTGIEQFEKQFGTTIQSMTKGAEALKIITPQQAEYLNSLANTRDEGIAWNSILDAMNKRFGEQGVAIGETTNQLTNYWENLRKFGPVGGIAAFVLGGQQTMSRWLPGAIDPVVQPDPRRGSTFDPLAERASAAIARHSEEFEKQRTLTREINTLKEHQLRLEGQIALAVDGSASSEEARVRLNKELEQNLQTQRNIQLQIINNKGGAEKDDIKRRMQGFEEEVRAAEGNTAKILEIRERQVAYTASIYPRDSAQFEAVENQKTGAARNHENQRYSIWEEGQRRRMTVAAFDIQQQLSIQREVVAEQRRLGRDVSHREQFESALTQLASTANAVAQRNYQLFAQAERLKLQEAQGNWAKIREVYREWADEASRLFGRNSTQFKETQLEMARAAQSAFQQTFQEQIKEADSLGRLNSAYLGLFRNNMQSQVRERKMSAEQAAGYEIQYATQLNVQLAAQYDAILATEGLKREVYVETYLKRLQLEADHAKTVSGLQDKMVQAAQRTTQQMTETFKRGFDQIGSALENIIVGALDRTMTRQQAAQQLRQSLIRAVTQTVSGIGNQLAGRGLAKMLGLEMTEGKDTTITSVLGQWITGALGLGGKTQDESLRTTQQSLTQAVKGSQQYVEQNTQALKELSQKLVEAKSIGTGAVLPQTGRGGAGPAPSEMNFEGSASIGRARTITVPAPVIRQVSTELARDFNERLDRALAAAREAGMNVSAGSRFRTYQEQVALYDKYGGVGVAKPGGSLHGMGDPSAGLGLANDVRGAYGKLTQDELNRLRPFLEKENLWAPLENWPKKKEPWHIEPREARGADLSLSSDLKAVSQAVISNTQSNQSQNQQLTMAADVTKLNNMETQKDTQVTQEGNTADKTHTSEVQKNTQALEKVTQAVTSKNTSPSTGTGGLAGTGTGDYSDITAADYSRGLGESLPGDNATKSTVSNLTGGLNGLTSVVGLASGAMALFGGGLSETGRKIMGTISLLSSAMSLLSSFGSGGGGGIGGIFSAVKGIGSLLMAPFTGGTSLLGGLFGEHGMVIPSAAGGMKVDDGRGGTLAVVHPREMVLPAHLAEGLSNLIGDRDLTAGGGGRGGGTTTLNYNANVTGYQPFATRSAFEGMLRRNSSSMMRFVENAARNGWRPSS